MRVVYDVARVASVGFSELFGNLRHIWLAYRALRRQLLEARPSLLILIDFPEFNMRLARIARRHGISVLYYISPQVWAWRRYRIQADRRERGRHGLSSSPSRRISTRPWAWARSPLSDIRWWTS